MLGKKAASLLTMILIAAGPLTVTAEEINYSTIERSSEKTVTVKYKGPWGEERFDCDIETANCETAAESDSPEILGQKNYPVSPDGNYAIITLGSGTANPVYALYQISGNSYSFRGLIPYKSIVSKILFSPLSTDIFFFNKTGEIFRYDIASRETSRMQASQNDFPQRIISPNGKYVSAYNYTKEAHLLWDLDSSQETLIPGESPSYVEFSENENFAAFTDQTTGFDTLYLKDLRNAASPKRTSEEGGTVIDYLFADNKLFYISNNQDDVYDWNLYEYDILQETTSKIAENVSYADYLKRINGKILFLQIEGKNTNVVIYDPESQKISVLKPIEDSLASSEVERKVVNINGVHGALLEPENSRNDEEVLFVWLHGGPQRQTSPAYHSYLSYAVYDELLDRLVESGATVLKLDYTGSFGYGQDFIDDLSENIGKVDVQDVLKAVEELDDDKDFEKIYLIGNSYGGYLSMRTIVEEPNQFDGAIGVNGVYDWASLIERIPSSPFSRLFNGGPNEINKELYEKADINDRLDELDDDNQILLFFGEKDSTVPTWQTTEFKDLLKETDADFEVITFSGETHVISKRKSLDKLCEKITDLADLDDEVCEIKN